jgi:N-acetylglucosaminyldiphosphoundecaprenol N-acetyl-beta-D-mannosaminyltransferase
MLDGVAFDTPKSAQKRLTHPVQVAGPLAKIDGQDVNISSLSDAVAAILRRFSYPKSFLVCTLNLDHLVKLRRDLALRQAYARAELVTADGFSIVMLARLDGVKLTRTAGADLIEPLCRAAAEADLPVFLFGSSFQTLCACGRMLTASCPGLQIQGVYAPPRGFRLDTNHASEAMALIRESGARLCFVALGAPLQEKFAVRSLAETNGIGFLAIGAGLDFIAGTQLRCPALLRRMSLEWAWRCATNPRLTGRYFLCGILFLELLTKKLAFILLRGRPKLGPTEPSS